jgi:hypothetical protein
MVGIVVDYVFHFIEVFPGTVDSRVHIRRDRRKPHKDRNLDYYDENNYSIPFSIHIFLPE